MSTGEAKTNHTTGYIKLFRSIRKHPLWKASRKKSMFEAWMDLLLTASHSSEKEPVGFDMIIVERGQVLTSQEKLGKEWNWDRSTVRKFLKMLEDDEMIHVNATQKYTMITVCNYGTYQDVPPTKQQRSNISATSRQHQDNTYKELKNDNNVNNEKNDIPAQAPAPPENFKYYSEDDFYKKIAEFKDQYSKELLRGFFDYWREKNAKGMMRFQLGKTWSTKLRLITWKSNQFKNGNNPKTNGSGIPAVNVAPGNRGQL